MKEERFGIDFTVAGKKYAGSVICFTPTDTPPMQRVNVRLGGFEKIFVFYEIENGKNLFWYDLSKKDEQQMATVLAKALLKRMLSKGQMALF